MWTTGEKHVNIRLDRRIRRPDRRLKWSEVVWAAGDEGTEHESNLQPGQHFAASWTLKCKKCNQRLLVQPGTAQAWNDPISSLWVFNWCGPDWGGQEMGPPFLISSCVRRCATIQNGALTTAAWFSGCMKHSFKYFRRVAFGKSIQSEIEATLGDGVR